jgi:hypothetical protein
MPVLVPKHERIPGVFYALTQHGVELPVIDVTHPSFAIDHNEATIRALRERSAAEALNFRRKPRWLRRLLFFIFLRRSVIIRGLRSSEGTFLSGMNTYLLKLSSAHLASSFATAADRRLAKGAALMDVRLRLQIMAELLADKLCQDLNQSTPVTVPIFLLNIAGGPAMDSLNALILAQRKSAPALAMSSIQIAVLDAHDEAPQFGRNALAALQTPDGPLTGLKISFAHRHYDWNHPESLREIFTHVPDNAISLSSSEGGLFHYASDEVIQANLEALRDCTGRGFSFSGSLSLDTPANRASLSFSGAAIRFFKPDVFEALVRNTGWRIDRQVEVLRTLCFQLVKT